MQNNADLREFETATCSQDVAHWINSWVWTDDPRELGAALPFDLFPKQEEFLRWLAHREERKENGLVEKSRDMGVTWLCTMYALHGWLFRSGYSVGFGSRKLEYVDRIGDRKTIFEKLRFALYRLPKWMLPAGFSRKSHDCMAKLVNPENGATITGEGGDEIGRGDRTSIYFVDESASLEHPDSVEASLSQTTRCRIDVSTPKGAGGPFYRKRFSGMVPVFTFHWRDDPRKGEEWYEGEKRRLIDPVVIAQELDIDYTASLEGICIPAAWVQAAINLQLPESGRALGGFDVAEDGPDSNVLVPRRGPNVRTPIDWRKQNTTESAWRARDEAAALGLEEVAYDCVGVGAGIRGTWDTAERPLPFRPRATNTGQSPSEDWWPDGQRSDQKFMNLRAELWWKVRCRFERAFEYRKGISHKAEDMISIPNHPQLIAELSMPLYRRMETGKIKIESKDDMKKRGVKSPDFADALILSFACPEYNTGAGTSEAAEAAEQRWKQPPKDENEYTDHPDRWRVLDMDDGESNARRHGYYGRR